MPLLRGENPHSHAKHPAEHQGRTPSPPGGRRGRRGGEDRRDRRSPHGRHDGTHASAKYDLHGGRQMHGDGSGNGDSSVATSVFENNAPLADDSIHLFASKFLAGIKSSFRSLGGKVRSRLVRPSADRRAVRAGHFGDHSRLARRRPDQRRYARLARRLARLAGSRKRFPPT